MNRTLVILNLLVTSIHSIARPIDAATTSNMEDTNYKIEDQTRRIPDETDDVLQFLVKKDDVINSSDLNKVYSSIENKFAKTRSLKDQTENDGFKNSALEQERRATKSKSPEEKDAEESSDSSKAAQTETRTVKKLVTKTSKVEDDSKTGEKSNKSGAVVKEVEESKSSKTTEEKEPLARSDITVKIDGKSKDAKEKESKTAEVTSELNEVEKTTPSFRREVKDDDYLEGNDEINDKVASSDDSEREGYKIPLNDESNSSWDLLDDLPTSRRFMSQPIRVDVNAKAGNEIDASLAAQNIPETTIASRNFIPQGPPATTVIPIPSLRSTISIPHVHPAVSPQRRFIVPGFIKVHPVTVDYRRLLNQEGYNIRNKNIQTEPIARSNINSEINQYHNVVLYPDERSQIPLKSRNVIQNYNSQDISNTYPYKTMDFNTPKTPQGTTDYPLLAKLIEASEHPQKPNINGDKGINNPNNQFSNNISPNKNMYYESNGGAMQNYPSVPYVPPNNFYAVPQNYDVSKYVTGFGRSG